MSLSSSFFHPTRRITATLRTNKSPPQFQSSIFLTLFTLFIINTVGKTCFFIFFSFFLLGSLKFLLDISVSLFNPKIYTKKLSFFLSTRTINNGRDPWQINFFGSLTSLTSPCYIARGFSPFREKP